MQIQATLRPTKGLSFSGTYTLSRNLGSLGYIDYFNRNLDYGLLNAHRSHAFTSYGTYDLPFGPNRQFFSSVSPGVLGRIIGGWQLSWIHTMQSGRPGSTNTTTGIWGTGIPDITGDFDPKSGYVQWAPGARTGNYWSDRYVAVTDPQCGNVTTQQSLRFMCMLKAMRDTQSGKILFQNPLPGTRGNFARGQVTSPLTWNTDMALTKVIRVAEGKSFTLRIDAKNVFNHPFPSNGYLWAGSREAAPGDVYGNFPLMDLSWVNTSNRNMGYLDTKVGARTFQAKIRFDF